MPNTQQHQQEWIKTIFESDELNIEENLVYTPTPISKSEIILLLERRLEEFSRSIENRLLSIEIKLLVLAIVILTKKITRLSSGFCLDLLKDRVADLERQVTEKDAITSFLSKQLTNKNSNDDSCTNTTLLDHNKSFHERV